MKIKNNKAFTGIDVMISLIIILFSVSIIVTLSYNFSLTSKKIERKGKAVQTAIQVLENLKLEEYNMVYDDMTLDNIEISKGYDVQIDVKSYQDYILETKGETVDEANDIIKVVKVSIEYNVGKSTEKIDISTILVNTNI